MIDTTSRLLQVQRAVARATDDLGAGDLVLVACSGGPDSLALAAAAARLGSRPGAPRFGAVIVDHGLQVDSNLVARAAADACHVLGLAPVEVVTVAVAAGSGSGGPEAAARTARLGALRGAARQHGADAVLLGHTLDDQAETVLLGLARGSGARSLGGMAPVSGLWRRPALRLRRSILREACAEAGLRPHWDPHNTDPSFTRSRVRNVVMPTLEIELGPGVAGALARTADMMRADTDALDQLAVAWMEARQGGSEGGTGIPVRELADQPEAIRTRVLRFATISAGVPPGALTREHVLRVDRLVSGWRGQGAIALPGRVSVERHSGRIVFTSGQ